MSKTTLLYAGYSDGRYEWVHGEHQHGSRYLIATLPLEGTSYAFCDLVEVRLSGGTPYIAKVVKPSPWRAVRFDRAHTTEPRFRTRSAQVDDLDCIMQWTNRGNGAIAFRVTATVRLGRLLRQMEAERLVRLIDEHGLPLPAAEAIVA